MVGGGSTHWSAGHDAGEHVRAITNGALAVRADRQSSACRPHKLSRDPWLGLYHEDSVAGCYVEADNPPGHRNTHVAVATKEQAGAEEGPCKSM